MAKNKVTKTFYYNSTWTCPAGVKTITVSVKEKVMGIKATTVVTTAGLAKNIFGNGYTWGYNSNGQLGDNTIAHKSSPIAVIGGYKFVQITTNDRCAYGLTASGDCYAWGYNFSGELGDGTTVNKSSPVLVIGGYKFVAISGNGSSACGLTTSGDCYAWGNNSNGQLGDGTTVNKSSPVLVIGGYKFTQIAGNALSAYGLTGSGDIYAWGYNVNGQLGDGTLVSKSSPVAVIGGYKFVQMAANYYNCYGLTASGNCYSWGANASGQIGDGSIITNKSSPVLVAGGYKFVQVTAGNEFALGLTVSGSAYGWGSGSFGCLGDNTTFSRRSPTTAVVGGYKFAQLFADGLTTYGLTTSGDCYAWGNNTYGQLGDNTITHKSSPVAVVGGYKFASNRQYTTSNPNKSLIISVIPGTNYSINFSAASTSFENYSVASGSVESLQISYET